VVCRVSDEDAELLRHLRDVGLVPDADVEVLAGLSAAGVLRLRVNGQEQTIGVGPANAVFVSPDSRDDDVVVNQEPDASQPDIVIQSDEETAYGAWKRARRGA
jgi:Fe2+ transport system protein FeoA